MKLSRRDLVISSGALTISAITHAKDKRMSDKLFEDGYFLSSRNPIATIDQKSVEDRAIRLMRHPLFQRAQADLARMLKGVMAADMGEEIVRFDAFLEEYMFHYAMRAANNDPDHPTIMRFMTPPHHWFGRDVPGSRWGADSPDFIYRVVTTSYGPRYEIHGRATSAESPTVTWSLLADRQASSVVHSTLNSVDMEFGANGEFTITIDPSPANGRKNHIQTQPDCYAVWVRDQLGDWSTTSANRLRVVRLDPPARPPRSDDELALWGANAARDGIYYLYFLTRTTFVQPKNVMRKPATTADLGGMPGQYSAGGVLRLAHDEAYLVNCNAAGALFRNTVLTDYYWLTLDYWNRQTSLNSGQMAPDADGNFTFVYAARDPGIHNWVDTCGMAEVRVGHRWQSFIHSIPDEELFFRGKLVKFADLERELPAGAKRIDATGRKAQFARRKAGYDQRFIDS